MAQLGFNAFRVHVWDAEVPMGWEKPVFYNISESPAYADAIAKAKVEGYSFQ